MSECCLLEIRQEELINLVIEALGLNAGTVNGRATLAEAKYLVKGTDDVAHSNFSYSSVVGMLLHLSRHS